MKTKFLVGAFAFLTLAACKESNEDKAEIKKKDISEEKMGATYAELSIKEGGSWNTETREYVEGSFKNVDYLEVPAAHTDHSWYIRYEGPGWENKQVAYRLYLDWRNALDIFGKRVDTLVLPYVGQDGFDSYHENAPWGQDILKAGKSMGIGGYGRFTGDTIAHFNTVEKTTAKVDNSDTVSTITINYTGWKTGEVSTNLKSEISIFPQDRFLKISLTSESEIEGLATGIVKFDDIPLIEQASENGKWAYLATYGKQTLAGADDQLGMALFYNTAQATLATGPDDHLVIFNPSVNTQTYYILAAWDQEKGGITSKESFVSDLNLKLQKLEADGVLE
tara:strand:+ start:21210 stop:22217 length:1008 start_codon:yes stop_codon:yes gene_type:complete